MPGNDSGGNWGTIWIDPRKGSSNQGKSDTKITTYIAKQIIENILGIVLKAAEKRPFFMSGADSDPHFLFRVARPPDRLGRDSDPRF
jgi:hypothetical protein